VKSEEWDEYEKRYPAIAEKKIFRSNDEYAYTGAASNLKLALAYALTLDEMFRHSDSLKMAAFTMGTSTLDSNATGATLNPIGLLFKLYRDHLGELPVEVSGNSPVPAPRWPAAPDQPRINAGSPTYPLDISAAFTSDRKFLTIAVVNPTESAQQMQLDLHGIAIGGSGKMWQLTGPSLDAVNHVGQKPQVEIVETAAPSALQSLPVAPASVTVYQFAVQ
jgi:alpha-L-arabinofuranosidase